jgi:hypothetical protein
LTDSHSQEDEKGRLKNGAIPVFDTFIEPTLAPLTWTRRELPASDASFSISTSNSRWPAAPDTAPIRVPDGRQVAA